jgi:hypothetical protein
MGEGRSRRLGVNAISFMRRRIFDVVFRGLETSTSKLI